MSEIVPHLNHKQELLQERLDRGPGQILADARKQAEKSIDEIAHALHVSPQVIDRLERDDYAQLPPTIFVRGYLRTFAKEVGLDPKEILARHTALTGSDGTTPDEPLKKLGINGKTSWLTPYIPMLFWGTLALLIVIMIVLIGSFWGDAIIQGIKSPFVRESTTSISIDGSAPPLARHGEVALPLPASSSSEPLSVNDESNSDSSLPSSPSRSSETESKAEGVSSGSLPTLATGATGLTDATHSDAPSQTNSNEAPQKALSSTLVLRFNERSWIRVIDANGKRLIAGEVPRSEVRTLAGTPPYRVRIGNASGVTVEHNGQSVAFTPQASGNVAEFTIHPL